MIDTSFLVTDRERLAWPYATGKPAPVRMTEPFDMPRRNGSVRFSPARIFDPAGKKISAPIFLILGHELIHATHNEVGHNRREKTATDTAAYPNLEEEETIATGGGATENKLRTEHGLGVRKGHALVDTR